jgi:serine/threonine protein phosphatase PrpC
MWAPKRGNSEDEFEDAYWFPRSRGRRRATVRCAVADGATEASFSGEWARLLVQAYGRGQLDDGKALHRLQAAWRAEVAGRPLPWYAEEKLKQGAFSSLLGLTLDLSDARPRWNSVAVGDSCLFQVRDDVLVAAYPLSRSDEFGSTPHLIGSVAAANRCLADHVRRLSGEAEPGDLFFIMTDALASWFLSAAESGETPWTDVHALRGPAAFRAWVQERRSNGAIRNDDSTVLLVEVL